MSTVPENLPAVVSRDEWLEARKALLLKEKEHTKAGDRVNEARRRLPMVKIEKDYVFEDNDGRELHLADLFHGRDQLVIQHVMWAPTWEQPCSSCASGLDSIPRLRQLHTRNTSFIAVSRVSVDKLNAFRTRMGWDFPWYATKGNGFCEDFFATLNAQPGPYTGKDKSGELEEIPGLSAFLRVGDDVYHTYSTTSRGVELIFGEYPLLDLTALGRQEAWEQPKGRAKALGLEAGGSALVMPDQIKA